MFEFEMGFYQDELNVANNFFIEITNYFEFLATFYDNWTLFEDFIKLPGGIYYKFR